MVAKGKIILLNGASSSGKTCIAKELQKLLDEPYMHLGIDTVFTMIPQKCKCYDPSRLKAFVWAPQHNQHAEVQISVGFLGHNAELPLGLIGLTGDVIPIDQDRPFRRLQESVQHSHSGGLACPIGTQEAKDLARVHLEANVIYG